jgi:hypothetical protein
MFDSVFKTLVQKLISSSKKCDKKHIIGGKHITIELLSLLSYTIFTDYGNCFLLGE